MTDADALVGYLHPDTFAEGRLKLDLRLAREAIEREIGSQLSADAAVGADGTSQVVEQGKNLADCVMVAFGGNGPLHATRVADKVGIRQIVVPPQPGVGSAVGFLSAPVSFFVDGRAVGLTSCTSHMYDLGGLGMGPNGSDVHDEGLFITPLKLCDRGEVSSMFVDFSKANSRCPESNEGDLYALIACCDVAGRRVAEMMHEFALPSLDQLGAFILDKSNQASKAAIAKVPNGVYENDMTIDGYDFEITLKATMTVTDDKMVTDFTGSSPCSKFGINVPRSYAEAYSVFGIRCVVGPEIPNNAGSLSPFVVSTPVGCILNAPYPAPVAMRHTIGQIMPDLVFGCMNQALPGLIPAEGASCMWDLSIRSAPMVQLKTNATVFAMELTHNGGTGARPQLDGLSVTAYPSGVWGSQVEITESVVPVRAWHRKLIPDSGGPGARRGGLGQIIELESAERQPILLLTSVERVVYPARGRNGGGSGRVGHITLRSGPSFPGKGEHLIPGDDLLYFETPGGGTMVKPSNVIVKRYALTFCAAWSANGPPAISMAS